MSKDLSTGDHVAWKTSQGETTGTVKRKVTSTTTVKGYTAKATKDDPQFVVESDKSGQQAVHHPDALTKKAAAKSATKKTTAKKATAEKATANKAAGAKR